MAVSGEAETKKKVRRPDTTFLWSGELDADVAAAESSTLSPATIEATCNNPTDWENVISEKEKEKIAKKDDVADQSTKVGCVDKLKDLITGPKPKEEHEVDSHVDYIHRGFHRGPIASPGLAAPALAGRPVGTHDVHHKVDNDVSKLVPQPKTEGSVHGGLGSDNADGLPDGSPKKEGVISKVIHKFHLGTSRD